MANGPDKPLMRSLGEFFGHIAKGVKTDPSKPTAPPAPTPTTRATVEERVQETAQGKVILRRTIIEEVVMPDDKNSPPPTRP